MFNLKSFCARCLAMLMVFSVCDTAFAGGLAAGTQAATNFQVWLYGFLAVCAVIYLGYKGGEAWMDKAHWSEFVVAIGKVAAVGSVVILAPWAWNVFVG